MVDSESDETSKNSSKYHQNNWSPNKNENIKSILNLLRITLTKIAQTMRNDSEMGSNVNLDKSPSYVSTVLNFNIRNKLRIKDMIKQKRYI